MKEMYEGEDTMSQKVYECHLNGKFYGAGDLNYMNELFKDYVVTCEMYGKKQVEFVVKERKRKTDGI